MADNEIRNPAKAYFKWKMPVIAKSEDDWNFWNTEDKYNRTMFIGYNDTTTPHVASLFIIVDGKPMQAVGDDVIARIAGLETNTAQALADIQALIDRVNAQQLEISNLQQECQRILEDAESAVRAAQIWAEGTDAQVAEKGGEHSAKGWAQKANDIVASGLPSDVTFDHLTVTGSSKFGQDPDRANQPGLEIEGTGEIQAYRTVNMMNGATVSYDETVEMPWSDSSNKVPNTAWVQQAVMHGVIDPNTELTVKKISTSTGGAFLNASHTASNGNKQQAYLNVHKATSDTDSSYIQATVYSSADSVTSSLNISTLFTRLQTPTLFFDGGNKSAGTEAIRLGQASSQAYQTTRYLYCEYTGRFVNGLQVGFINDTDADGIPFKVVRSDTSTVGKWTAAFGVTPTVPDITDAADSSDKVPNTKWVQAAIAAGGGGGGSGAVTSVNGKTGEVVLAAADVGAATTADITTALEPYAKTADATTTLADYAKSADVTTEITTATAGLQPKLTAGANIPISQDNVIAATGGAGGAVTSVNGKTGEVVLSASDVGAASSSDLANYVTTDAMNTELTHYSTTAAIDAKLADYQRKLIAGDGIAISESNVISVTGGTGGGAVSSVNGKTGEVVLNATDVGAITGAEADTKITTALEPYAKSADVTADITAAVAPLATTEALTTGLAGKQDVLKAGYGITITNDNTIAASSDVTSVNGMKGDVKLYSDNIKVDEDPEAVTVKAALAGKQGTLTAESDLSVNNLTVNNLTSAKGLTSETGTVSAKKIQTVADTTYNADGSFTRVCLRDIVTKSGTYGYVTLSGDEIRINGKNSGKALTYLSSTGIYDTTAKPAADASNTRVGTTAWVQSAITAKTANLQPKLTAGEGITISAENVISATGGGAVTSVNGNTGAVVLTGDNVMTASDSTTSINTALAGKQDSLTASSDLTVGSLTAGSADSGLYAGTYSIRYTYNGNDKLFVDATGPYVSNLTGGDLGTSTGAFNWYINTTTDYNKFNVFNRYYVTDEATHEVTTYDSTVFSIGGSPTDHSTWIDFTANYLSFKGDTNFGETGMNHKMNFNGTSRFHGGAGFYNTVVLGHGETTEEGEGGTPTTTPASQVYVDGNLEAYGSVLFSKGFTANDSVSIMGNTTFWKVDAEGGIIPFASYDKSTGVFNIDYLTSTDGGTSANRVTIMADSRETNYGATFNLPVTVSDASFKRTSTLAADDNSTEVPTTAWVKSAIAAGGGGSVPDDITCKTLKVTNWDSGLDSIEFAGNLKYSGDYGNGSLGIITAREFFASSSGYYSTRVSTSGIILSYGSGGNQWFNADSSTRTLTIDGTFKSSTPDAGSNNTDVATTAWVNTAITNKAASTNADNFSVAGKTVLSGMGMPSGKYLDVTVGANGSLYTAPANGYFFSTGVFNQDNGAIRLLNNSKHSFGTSATAGKAWSYAVFVPCQKGDQVALFFQSIGEVKLTFLYAEGDQKGEN